MPNEMTAAEAAEKLEALIDYAGDTLDDALEFDLRQVVKVAASLCRKIAAGEYKQVAHGKWLEVDDNVDIGTGHHKECSNCHVWSRYVYSYCPSCGALMDGKDDSHA